ncbi:MAG TPA: hypothetical protein VNV82_19680 [Bryobacteraceae bacterium]|nr:hypothetical protein [Bryobacteraceae bacterium]
MTVKQHAFLAAYSKQGNVSAAAKAAKIGRRSHSNWLKEPEYRTAFEDAREEAADYLEGQAWKRATSAKKPSDVLLIFLLKGIRPEKFRENLNLSGSVGISAAEAILGARRKRMEQQKDGPCQCSCRPCKEGRHKECPYGEHES